MCSSHSREFCGWNWTSFTLQFTCSRPSWFVVLGVGATSISTMQGHEKRCFGESSGAFGGLHGHLKEWHIYAECYNLQKEMVNTSEGHYHQCNSCHDIGQHKFLKSKKHTDIARMRFSLAQRARVAQHEKQLSHRGIALAWPWSGWLGSSCSSCKTNVGSRISNLTTWLRANRKESTWRSDAPHVLPLQIQKKLWDLIFCSHPFIPQRHVAPEGWTWPVERSISWWLWDWGQGEMSVVLKAFKHVRYSNCKEKCTLYVSLYVCFCFVLICKFVCVLESMCLLCFMYMLVSVLGWGWVSWVGLLLGAVLL